MDLYFEEGKVVGVKGSSSNPQSQGYLCPKGKAIMELLYAPDRLKYPMRREGNTWKKISWDEALEVIVQKLKEIKEKYRAEAVVIHMGQAGVAQDIRPLIQRFCNVFGTPNFSSSGSQCHLARVMGNALTYGYFPVPDINNTKCIVVWGSNPTSSNPLMARRILESQKRGAKLIVIDPRLTPLAKKADFHLMVRPGTDGALALSILNVIISERLHDEEFVEKWTIGFDKLVELVAEYPPTRIAEMTWVPANIIKEAAFVYGTTKPACIIQGNALEHHNNAVQSIRAVSILQSMTGNLDLPGGALWTQVAPLTDITLGKERCSKVEPLGAVEHPLFNEFAKQAQANLLPEAILTEKPYPIKAMIVSGANPALTFPNTQKTKEALCKLDFLVVMDLFMTETAKIAHIVLPAVTFLERTEICDYGRFGTVACLAFLNKVLPEQGESWSDWKFWTELGRRMGYEEYFPWTTPEEIIDDQLEPLGVTTETLEKEPGGIVYSHRKYRKYENSGFKTPSGKVEIYSEKLKKLGYDPLPVYKEPDESPVSKSNLAKEYPLILTTGARILEYIHSRFRNLPSLRQRVPEPWMEIHPETAKEFGVRDGEEVIVESLRGSIKVKAKFTEGILPILVQISHGWNEANANILTDDETLDPISGFPPLRSLLCRVRKKGN
jgi:anaerobic selenocysteine-containing dehydrogenase